LCRIPVRLHWLGLLPLGPLNVVRSNFTGGRQNGGTFDQVLQFAHVPGQAMRVSTPIASSRTVDWRALRSLKRVKKWRTSSGMSSRRSSSDGKRMVYHAEAVVQIFAKLFGTNALAQIRIRCGENPDINRRVCIRPTRSTCLSCNTRNSLT